MESKSYSINPAKIGNQQGWRLPNVFYKDNPHLAETSGQIEVLNEDTLLVRLDRKTTIIEEDQKSLMMSLFLDFLMKDVVENPDKLVPYTETMSTEIDNLLTDVTMEQE